MENVKFNYRNCNDELAIKLIGKLTLEMPQLESDLPKQLKIKRIIEEVIYNYEVTSKETSLVVTDLEEKINYFLATKKLEGLSPETINNYRYILCKLYKYFNKPVTCITTGDIKMMMYKEAIMKFVNHTSINDKYFLKQIYGYYLTSDSCFIKVVPLMYLFCSE